MADLRTLTGQALSKDHCEALADEAERGYDLTKAKPVRVGRRALGQGGASPRVQIRVDPDLAAALRKRARQEKRSLSDIARAALREYVER